jgi:hypothetical protein
MVQGLLPFPSTPSFLALLPSATLQTITPAGKLVAMPELPDITAYLSALESRIIGQPLEHARLNSAFLLRTAQPPLTNVEGELESASPLGWKTISGFYST